MKKTLKLLSVIMIAVLALSMVGCKAEKKRKTKKREKVSIEEIQKNTGDMLVISCSPQFPMTQEEYDASSYTMRVTYDGYVYIPNPVNSNGLKMKDDDFLKLYYFCTGNAEHSDFEGYSEDVCDGETYSFIYYDLEGGRHVIYAGYCYANDELQDILKTVSSYQVD